MDTTSELAYELMEIICDKCEESEDRAIEDCVYCEVFSKIIEKLNEYTIIEEEK